MEKRSTFDPESPIARLFTETVVAAAFIPILTLCMWVWDPIGMIANRNVITATACTSDGSICGVATWHDTGRTFWNYNTDAVGVFYSVVPAICIAGLALILYWGLTYISNCIFERIKYKDDDLVSVSPWPSEKTSARTSHEPYVSDDPQQQATPDK